MRYYGKAAAPLNEASFEQDIIFETEVRWKFCRLNLEKLMLKLEVFLRLNVN